MNRKIVPIVAWCLGIILASAALAEEPAMPAAINENPQSVTDAPTLELAAVAVCEKVEDREPVGDATSFSNDIGTLWCFTDVRNAQTTAQIYHRWFVGEKMVNEIPINVKGPRWRCWSKKTIPASWQGACRVEIVTEEGDVLGTTAFQLDAAETVPGTSEPMSPSAG